jgi:hypothetical protein
LCRCELRCTGRVSSSSSKSGIRRVTLIKNLVKSWLWKGRNCYYDERNICLVIYDTNIL